MTEKSTNTKDLQQEETLHEEALRYTEDLVKEILNQQKENN